jgi:hypothetical protein
MNISTIWKLLENINTKDSKPENYFSKEKFLI